MSLDTLLIIAIIAIAGGYLIYRYAFKKKGGCGCGCSGCDSGKGNNKHTPCK